MGSGELAGYDRTENEMNKQLGGNQQPGERGANLDSQSGSNQEVVSVAEPDENEIKEKKENEMKECSDECRSKFRFQLFGKCYLKKNENDEVDARAEQPKLDRGDDD